MLIEYDMYYGLYRLNIPGFRARFYAKRSECIRLLGRFVQRFGSQHFKAKEN